MPRRNQKKVMQRNPMLTSIFGKIMGSLCETKKIESATRANITTIFEGHTSEEPVKKELAESILTDIVIDIINTFRVDSSLKQNVILVGPPTGIINKKAEYLLPPLTDKTLTRIVLISGSHGLFTPRNMSSIMGNEQIFIPQGSAMEVSASFGDLKYDDKSYYDKTKFNGKGFLRAESRHLIVVDFLCDDEELLKKKTGEDIEKAGKNLAKTMAGSGVDTTGLIQNLMKNFGGKKD